MAEIEKQEQAAEDIISEMVSECGYCICDDVTEMCVYGVCMYVCVYGDVLCDSRV